MRKMIHLFGIFALLVGLNAQKLTAAIITDVHQMIEDPRRDAGHMFGVFHDDSPPALVKSAIAKIKEAVPHIDMVLMLGDTVDHYSNLKDKYVQAVVDRRESITKSFTHTMAQSFPEAIIFYIFGNNDGLYKNLVPTKADKTKYYQFYYENFILKHAPNNVLDTIENMQTFLDGGYYYHDVTPYLRVIAMNTLYYYRKGRDNIDPESARRQLIWFEKKMEECDMEGKKALILQHISFELDYGDKSSPSWNKEYLDKYQEIAKKYKDSISAVLVGHVHLGSQRIHAIRHIPLEEGVKKYPFDDLIVDGYHKVHNTPEEDYTLYQNLLAMRSLSPYDGTNPGFTVMKFQKRGTPKKMIDHSMDLEKAKLATSIQESLSYWTKLYSSDKELNMNDLSPEELKTLHGRLLKHPKFLLKYLILMAGFKPKYKNVKIALAIYKKERGITKKQMEIAKICPEKGFRKCINSRS